MRTGCRKAAERFLGIAHAVDVQRQPGGAGRIEQIAAQFGAALIVAPVADPHQPLTWRVRLVGGRVEEAQVRRLVPGPDAIAPPPLAIDLRKRLAKGQDAIIAGEIEGADRFGIAHGAMMGIMEQQGEPGAGRAPAAECGHQRGIVPLVDDDEIGRFDHFRPVVRPIVDKRAKLGIGRPEAAKALRPVIGEQIFEAPGAARLAWDDVMAPRDQLAQHTTQEMRIAVAPAGEQRMGEIDDLHAASLRERGRSSA